ncbi:MAG TPA: thermonuclease family protein [Stenomitos sp.]
MNPLRTTLAAAALVVLWALPSHALTLTGKVVKVADGDTITIMTDGQKERIRLLGIDTPEKKQPVWGPAAKDFTTKLVMGKDVRVETDVEERDHYGRVLGYVYVGKTFVNLELVRQGYAMLYTSPPNVAHTDEFVAAQKEAREAGRNIWNPKNGLTQTPYEFRHKGKKAPKKIQQEGLPAER